MKLNQIASELKPQIKQKDLARALEITPRTLRNWSKKTAPESFPKLGRPAHDERAHRNAFWCVGREYVRQGGCSWRSTAHALGGSIPIRLIQTYTRLFKSCEKRHERRRILLHRQQVEVLAKNALWVQDGAQVGRNQDGKPIESQVVKDRGSLVTVGIRTGEPARGRDAVALLDQIKKTRGLPLVLGSDNGSPYICRETEAYLKHEQVIHLKSLPRTPQHNGAAEVGIGELKRCAKLNAAWITTPEIAHRAAVKAANLINKNRLRQSKGFKTATILDETMVVGYHQVERGRFYEECSKRIQESQLGKISWREKRMGT